MERPEGRGCAWWQATRNKKGKQQASDSESLILSPLKALLLFFLSFLSFSCRTKSYTFKPSPSILHPSSSRGLSLWNSSPLALLVSGKLITLLPLLDFLWMLHLALFLGAATATNSSLIYVMTVEGQTVSSAAHQRGWRKRHARKHIAGKVYSSYATNCVITPHVM